MGKSGDKEYGITTVTEPCVPNRPSELCPTDIAKLRHLEPWHDRDYFCEEATVSLQVVRTLPVHVQQSRHFTVPRTNHLKQLKPFASRHTGPNNAVLDGQ
jgi:hypothetical protein